MTKEDNEDFKQSTKCHNDSLTMIMLMMLKKEINVISLENIEPLHIETVISQIKSQSSCRISQQKTMSPILYARAREIQSYNKCYTKKIKKKYELYVKFYRQFSISKFFIRQLN